MPQVQAVQRAPTTSRGGESIKSQLTKIDAKISELTKSVRAKEGTLLRAMLTPAATRELQKEIAAGKKELKSLDRQREKLVAQVITAGGTFVIKRVAKFDKDLAAKRRELNDHKGMMMRALLTPEASRRAEAKLARLEHDVKKLEAERAAFIDGLLN